MMTATECLHGGLSSLAETLQVERIGPMHQAGSDSLLTAQVFFGLTKKHFNGVCEDSRYFHHLSLLIYMILIGTPFTIIGSKVNYMVLVATIQSIRINIHHLPPIITRIMESRIHNIHSCNLVVQYIILLLWHSLNLPQQLLLDMMKVINASIVSLEIENRIDKAAQ
jgi:hypothetical protein